MRAGTERVNVRKSFTSEKANKTAPFVYFVQLGQSLLVSAHRTCYTDHTMDSAEWIGGYKRMMLLGKGQILAVNHRFLNKGVSLREFGVWAPGSHGSVYI